jgi:hypothetical protein
VSRTSKKLINNSVISSPLSSETHQQPTINDVLERKILIATEGFTTKYSESTLRDRSKLSEENALTVSEYIISMKRETLFNFCQNFPE